MSKSIDIVFRETMEQLQPDVISYNPQFGAPTLNILTALKADPDLLDRFVETLLTYGDLEIFLPCKNEILDLIITHRFTTVTQLQNSLKVHLKEGHIILGKSDLPRLDPLPDQGILIEKCQYTYPAPFHYEGRKIVHMTKKVGGQAMDSFYIPITLDEAVQISNGFQQQVQ